MTTKTVYIYKMTDRMTLITTRVHSNYTIIGTELRLIADSGMELHNTVTSAYAAVIDVQDETYVAQWEEVELTDELKKKIMDG